MDLAVWSERIDGMIAVIQSLRRSADAEEILLPGERSHRRSIENTARGVRLDPKTLAELDTLCSEYNIESISARMTLAAAGRGAEDSGVGSP
jgi:LDH2 family malate/lactate/ureidoglycolate dehydrogenase